MRLLIGLGIFCLLAAVHAGWKDDVLNAIDTEVDPCDNFYYYSCGNWIKENPLPGDKSRYTRSFTVISDTNADIMRAVLEDSSETNQATTYYDSCMDMDAVDEFGTAGVYDLFSLVENVSDNATFIDAVGALHAHGITSPLFGFLVDLDAMEPDHYISIVFQGGLSLPDRSYYLDTSTEGRKTLRLYYDHIIRVFKLLGEPDADTIAGSVLGVERRLAEAAQNRDELTDPFVTYNKLNLDGLQELAPSIPWDRYFKAIGRDDVTEINVATPEFFPKLEEFVLPLPAEELKRYLKWHAVHSTIHMLPQEFLDEDFAFFGKVLYGMTEMAPRWRDCIDASDVALGELTGALYVKEAFGNVERLAAQAMILAVEKSMEETLEDLDWMDETTRAGALDKMKKLTNLIGFPSDPDTYDDLDLHSDSYFTNSVDAWSYNFGKQVAKIEKEKLDEEWLMRANEVNAYYNPTTNQMAFPAGILQSPFFSLDYPWSMNFGAIGVVMGHEISHGFDNAGSQYNGDGVLENWWEPETADQFQEKVDCVIEQYSNYTLPSGTHVNGNLTQGENVADNAGLMLAYESYKRLLSVNPLLSMQDPSNVGDLTNEQLLFVAFAQSWCTTAAPSYLEIQVKTDPHSPSEFRVLGPTQNSPEFASAFNCPASSPMVPEKRCKVW